MSQPDTWPITDSLAAAKEAFDDVENALATSEGTATTATAAYLRVIALALIAIAEGMPQE